MMHDGIPHMAQIIPLRACSLHHLHTRLQAARTPVPARHSRSAGMGPRPNQRGADSIAGALLQHPATAAAAAPHAIAITAAAAAATPTVAAA